MATIALASSRPVVDGPDLPYIDKVVHFLVYGLLGTLFARVPAVGGWAWLGRGWAVVLASAYGVVDEFHQSFTPGRFVEVGDWLADTLGALLAVALYSRWAAYRKLLERPIFGRTKRRVESSAATMPENVA
jgi:VanZ family protein